MNFRAPRLLEGIADGAPGPEARYGTKEAVALASVSGLQQGPCSCFATCSASPRARWRTCWRSPRRRSRAPCSGLVRRSGHAPRGRISSASQRRCRVADRDLVGRFAEAFENDDIDGVVALLSSDAIVSMPPEPEWHQGPEAVGRFLRSRHLGRKGPRRFVATGANGQPAFAYYIQDAGGWSRAGIFVVALRAGGIASITRFRDDGLLSRFGVPERRPDGAGGQPDGASVSMAALEAGSLSTYSPATGTTT